MLTGIVAFIIISVFILVLVKLSPWQKEYERKRDIAAAKHFLTKGCGIDPQNISVKYAKDPTEEDTLVIKSTYDEGEDNDD